MPVDHWMMFSTFTEQDHFEYPNKGVYKGVVINANMAAYAPAGLAAFLLEKTAADTKYLIDPLTHAFQHDPGVVSDQTGRPKASIRALAEAYGEPITAMLGERPLLPEHLEGVALEELVRRCLDYQANQIARYMQESDAAKYMDDPDELHPYALVAPYFFLTEAGLDEWLDVNTRAAQLACEISGQQRVFAAVVVDQGILLNTNARNRVLEAMGSVAGLSGFLVWADNLDEQTAAGAELLGLLALTRGLRGELGREVINLHGGYFSILAAGNLGEGAMTGVAHGPEFGEFRPVIPVGGGIPISKFYVPKLHVRTRYRDAATMFAKLGALESADAFHSRVCDCTECKETISGDAGNFVLFGAGTAKTVRRRHGLVRIQFPTSEARLRCLRHYLQRKHREYLTAANLDRDGLLENLRNGEAEYRAVAGSGGVAHLKLWRMVFGDDSGT